MGNTIKHIIDIELVKTILKSKGIDEKEAAKLLGITLPTLQRFLGGADQSRASAKILYNLAKGLNVSADSLLHKNYRR